MPLRTTLLSTADQRREVVVNSAIAMFAKTGYLGTPISAVAEHAQISSGYVFKLFPSKQGLFIAALERCFSIIHSTLARGAETSPDQTSDGVLTAMGGAYARLISDRELLMLQVHAQSAADEPEIAASLRAGLEKLTTLVKTRSNASDDAVQRFFAYGQLCHLVVTTRLDDDGSAWAKLLTRGIRHP